MAKFGLAALMINSDTVGAAQMRGEDLWIKACATISIIYHDAYPGPGAAYLAGLSRPRVEAVARRWDHLRWRLAHSALYKVSAVFSIPFQAHRHNASPGVFWNAYGTCTAKRRGFLPPITSPLLPVVYMMMHPRDCAQQTDLHGRYPIARRRDEVWSSLLSACAPSPSPSPTASLAVVETISWVLCYPRNYPGSASAPPSASSPLTGRSRAAEIAGYLRRTSTAYGTTRGTAPSCARPRARHHIHLCFSRRIAHARHPNVAPFRHPHHLAQSPPSSPHVGGADGVIPCLGHCIRIIYDAADSSLLSIRIPASLDAHLVADAAVDDSSERAPRETPLPSLCRSFTAANDQAADSRATITPGHRIRMPISGSRIRTPASSRTLLRARAVVVHVVAET
ncbi:hypothetical protein GGX14DRAFT_647925 [Mycena pura]|uniref:Uncharacterized protein n=1 Tax=Mycena pura TaxID=153505 RepID=A0AAD6VDA2_9AGAR|nr:hypothetical protein GGX14DRAFT_647925 [Mycena pura]